MTWATIAAAVNATVASHLGERGSLRSSRTGDVALCDGILIHEPTVIPDTGAYEQIPVAEIPTDQVTFTPAQGDLFTDALGKRWLADRVDSLEGMWRLTLRADPSA